MEGLLQSKKLKIVLLIIVAILIGFIIFASISENNKVSGGANSENEAIGENVEVDSDEALPTHADLLDEASLEEDEGEKVIYVPKNEIYSFSMTDANGIVLNFGIDNGKWVYTDNPEIAINQERIDKVLNYLCDIHSIDSINDTDGNEYGLTQESKAFTLMDSADDTIIISVGNRDESTGNVYFAINYDFSTVYINSGKLDKVSEYGIEDLIQL